MHEDDAHGDNDGPLDSSGAHDNKRIKVMEVGGSGGAPSSDVAKHQDQRWGQPWGVQAALGVQAAAIHHDMLDGIVGFGCTGYVFSLR